MSKQDGIIFTHKHDVPQLNLKISNSLETGVFLLMAIYIVFFIPRLSLSMISWLDSCVVKVILLLLILSIALEHPTLSILFLIALYLTLEHLYKLKNTSNDNLDNSNVKVEPLPDSGIKDYKTIEHWDPKIPKQILSYEPVNNKTNSNKDTSAKDVLKNQQNNLIKTNNNKNLLKLAKQLQENTKYTNPSDKVLKKMRDCAFKNRSLIENNPFLKSSGANPYDSMQSEFKILKDI